MTKKPISNIDDIVNILMSLEAKTWRELGEPYPVKNVKSMNKYEAMEALHLAILEHAENMIPDTHPPSKYVVEAVPIEALNKLFKGE